MPAVQPSESSVAVQSLAPAAWQMAKASTKVLSRAHGQPASDSPHTKQPLRRDPQSGESFTSEQQRTWPREGRGEHFFSAQNVIRNVASGHAPRAARLGHGDLQPRCKSPAARIRPGGTKAWSGEWGSSWRQRSSCTTRRASACLHDLTWAPCFAYPATCNRSRCSRIAWGEKRCGRAPFSA